MPEYRSLFDLPPSVLSRLDLLALAKLLEDGVPVNPHAVEYTAKFGDVSYRAKSITELLDQLPLEIAEIDFRVSGWTESNSIDRGVLIRLHAISASCQIHSLDEIWFQGRIVQIKDFFSRRRPWYAPIRPFILLASSALQPLLILAAVYLLRNNRDVLAGLALATLVALFVLTKNFINGRIFPFSRILRVERSSWMTRDTLMVTFTAVGAIASLVGVIVQALPKSPP